MIYTDHEPIPHQFPPHTVGADCAKAFSYWCLQSTIKQLGVPCSIRHIPGLTNPADCCSRGVDASEDPAWSEILYSALLFHGETEKVRSKRKDKRVEHEDEVYGVLQPERLATARNPYRPLFSSTI